MLSCCCSARQAAPTADTLSCCCSATALPRPLLLTVGCSSVSRVVAPTTLYLNVELQLDGTEPLAVKPTNRWIKTDGSVDNLLETALALGHAQQEMHWHYRVQTKIFDPSGKHVAYHPGKLSTVSGFDTYVSRLDTLMQIHLDSVQL